MASDPTSQREIMHDVPGCDNHNAFLVTQISNVNSLVRMLSFYMERRDSATVTAHSK